MDVEKNIRDERSSMKPATNSLELRADREQVVLVNLPHPACVFVQI